MHCLRWWLPIFLLPLPAASPFLLILFVISYFIRTKPCAYCSVIIIGLMLSTCSFYQYTPLQALSPTQSTSEPQEPVPGDVPLPAITTTAPSMIDTPKTQSSEKEKRPSSCWIDLSNVNSGQDSMMNLGKWSAHTWRRYPSVLSRSVSAREDNSEKQESRWKRLLHDGIFIGLNDVGFRLKFLPE